MEQPSTSRELVHQEEGRALALEPPPNLAQPIRSPAQAPEQTTPVDLTKNPAPSGLNSWASASQTQSVGASPGEVGGGGATTNGGGLSSANNPIPMDLSGDSFLRGLITHDKSWSKSCDSLVSHEGRSGTAASICMDEWSANIRPSLDLQLIKPVRLMYSEDELECILRGVLQKVKKLGEEALKREIAANKLNPKRKPTFRSPLALLIKNGTFWYGLTPNGEEGERKRKRTEEAEEGSGTPPNDSAKTIPSFQKDFDHLISEGIENGKYRCFQVLPARPVKCLRQMWRNLARSMHKDPDEFWELYGHNFSTEEQTSIQTIATHVKFKEPKDQQKFDVAWFCQLAQLQQSPENFLRGSQDKDVAAEVNV